MAYWAEVKYVTFERPRQNVYFKNIYYIPWLLELNTMIRLVRGQRQILLVEYLESIPKSSDKRKMMTKVSLTLNQMWTHILVTLHSPKEESDLSYERLPVCTSFENRN